MLFRKKEKDIMEWLENGYNTLLISGARQVGKTFIIRECLKKSKKNYIEINLVKNPEYIKMFEFAINKNISLFIDQLSIISNKPFDNEETIIFIDEVQECKEILTAIKFLVEDNSFRYILSGSLLGVELVNLRSAPVGYLRTIEMFPLDFEEFLIANGLNIKFIEQLKECYCNKTAVNELLHDKLIDALYKYLIIGGMPRAVQTYLDTNDFIKVSMVHEEIIKEYLVDFTKYEENKKAKLQLKATYNLIPSELNEPNKRYVCNHLDKNYKYDRYENSFNWLIDAEVALPVYNTTELKIPLEINKKRNLFKLFLSDVGMLTTMYGRNTILKMLSRDNDINYGAIFENFIAQELKTHGYKNYYYNNKKYGELDFVIEHKGEVLLLEIKSGKDYTRHSALNNVLEIHDYNIKNGYVLSNYNLSVNKKIIYLPIYMIMFINQDDIIIPTVNKINFSDLE